MQPTTPGRHFRDALGDFPTAPERARTGSAAVLLASGALTEVAGHDGLNQCTAKAEVGDGVLFLDARMDGQIKESREYVFTAWGERRRRNAPVERFRQQTREAPGRRPTAKDDMAALRSRFDTNNDGLLTNTDTDFGKFKVMATNAVDGQTAMMLAGNLVYQSESLRTRISPPRFKTNLS